MIYKRHKKHRDKGKSIKCDYDNNHRIIDINGNFYFQVLYLEDNLSFFNYCIENKLTIYKCTPNSKLPCGVSNRFILTVASNFNMGKGNYYTRKENYLTFSQRNSLWV